MYLIHEATIKNFDGVIDVHVHVVKEFKRSVYIYHIRSEWAVRQFSKFYRRGRKFHGRALKYLNDFKINK
jgi:hypothetical protein